MLLLLEVGDGVGVDDLDSEVAEGEIGLGEAAREEVDAVEGLSTGVSAVKVDSVEEEVVTIVGRAALVSE